MKPHHLVGIVAVMLGLAIIVAGCSKNESTTANTENKKATTQVAAKVNSNEITISQINNVLARNPNVRPEAAERAKREILERLIEAEIARAEAVTKKLDRTPAVLQALEAAKTEILARAYAEQIAAAQPKPTAEEVKKYFVDHPELFSQRRVYRMEEFSFAAKEGLAAQIKSQLPKFRSMDDLLAWLKTQGVTQIASNIGVRAAEQLPMEALPQFQAMKDGEMRVFEGGGQIQVIRMAASKLEPVDEARATPRIQQFLFAQRAREAVTKDMKLIKEKAKIEYVGEFAASAAEAEAKAKAAAEAKEKTIAAAKAKAAAETQSKEDELAKARRDAEARDKAEAAAKGAAKGAPAKSAPALTPEMEKGLKGVVR